MIDTRIEVSAGPHPVTDDQKLIEHLRRIVSLPSIHFHYKEDQAACALAADRLAALTGGGEPVAWRVKDFADGWIFCHSEAAARREAEGAGNLVQPLYALPPAAGHGTASTTDDGQVPGMNENPPNEAP